MAGDAGPFVGTCGFMGIAAGRYVETHGSAVEVNFTFHDRKFKVGCYDRSAAEFATLGLRVVLKVSGLATHDRQLEAPQSWWPLLRDSYASFARTGVLLGLLWQFPPTFICSEESVRRLTVLSEMLRVPGQPDEAEGWRHAFEFRHSSWYSSPSPLHALESFSLGFVRLHVMNDTGWAGDLRSGWHTPDCPSRFQYIRCMGAAGRSIGKYDMGELMAVAAEVAAVAAEVVVVMFGQGDVPSQALQNAAELRALLSPGSGPALASDSSRDAKQEVAGRITRLGHGSEVRLEVEGKPARLGTRHARRRGLQFRVGAVLENLKVEGEENGILLLSAHDASLRRPPASEAKIWLGNLPFSISAIELENHVRGFGVEPLRAEIRRGGQAMMVLPSPEAVHAAIAALDGSALAGRHLRADLWW